MTEQRNSPIVKVVNQVGSVEELRHRDVDELLRFAECCCLVRGLGIVREIKNIPLMTFRAVIVDPRVLAFPVLVSEDLQSKM